MSKVIKRTRCPQCAKQGADSSEDNLAIYADDSEYCFACGYYSNNKSNDKKDTEYVPSIVYKTLEKRGISEAVCKHFMYGVTEINGVTHHVAQYCNDMGIVVGHKYRGPNKRLWCGNGKITNSLLFGKHLYNPSDKVFVVVTEGELDALSIAEIQGKQYPVVSLPLGADSAPEAIRSNLEWLSGFKHVVLCFDMDDAGRKAVEKCASILPVGKVRVAKLPMKDANEMLIADKTQELKNALWSATVYRPDSILSTTDILEKGLVRPEEGLSWPWPAMTAATYGLRKNEVYMLGAGSGIGKSHFLLETTLHLANFHNKKVGLIYLEQTPAQTLLKLAGLMLNKKLHIPSEQWDEQEIRRTLDKVKDNIYIYDHFGAADIETVLGKIRYFVKALGCEFIILDHITALAALMQEERKGLDEAMAMLGGLVHELDCSFFIVSHLAKPMAGDSYEEGRKVTPSAFRGSQSIQYWSSYMLGLERNKLSEDINERNVLTVRVLKDRFSGESDGLTFKLQYNSESGRLIEMVDPFDQIGEVI